ncbi:MAG: calcium/sodium antiporter [Alphaproteobacteria bacterium]|nr:calcium/sodium antiporter [Alphaproteobacteria bacterium]
MSDFVIAAAGLCLLLGGGELLVRHAVKSAERLGISPLLIGITLVGFGTATPELVTCIQASLAGAPGIAFGNIVGSNITNILLILGVTAVIAPISVHLSALHRDGVFVLVTAIMFCAVGFLFPLDRSVGFAAVFLLGAYLFYAYKQEKIAHPPDGTESVDSLTTEVNHDGTMSAVAGSERAHRDVSSVFIPLATAVFGLVALIVGGRLLVDGAIAIAQKAQISETVIGLTLVAIGTSLPELATSTIAALRRHSDLALGNILGSNIYNILGVGGATVLVAPTKIPQDILYFHSGVMLAATVALLAIARFRYHIGRLAGLFFLGCYAVYIYSIVPI